MRKGYGVGVQKAIRSKLKAFKGRVHFRVGCGNRVKCWKDRRCGASR